jgi:catechol 2,3-dioxygenase-like lactoylglutathione lyase family enzyme
MTTSVPLPLFTRMSQTAIASDDPAKLVAFYRDVLGFRYAFETAGMHFLDIGGLMFVIGPKYPGVTIGGDATLYFEPTAWRSTEAALIEAGVGFVHDTVILMKGKDRELALRAFKDPEGHTLAMYGWRDAA